MRLRTRIFLILGAFLLTAVLLDRILFSDPSVRVDFSTGLGETVCTVYYVTIQNRGWWPIQLGALTIRQGNDVYPLPERTLWPWKTVRIWSGTGVDDEDNLYIGRKSDTWNLNAFGTNGLPFFHAIHCDPL